MNTSSKNTTRVYELLDFFNLINYDFKKDFEDIKEICKLTKTRPKENPQEFFMDYGSEQPFVLKAIVNKVNAETFFEIGTGRGTGSYSVALESCVKLVATLDRIPHFIRQNTAIEFKPIKISQRGLHKMILFKDKEKIKFFHNIQKLYLKTFYKNRFDIAFIDGNHTDEKIINNDIDLCQKLLKKDGIIIFDDYESDINKQRKFKVGAVVDEFLNRHDYYSYLIEFRGHLFNQNKKEKNAGVMVVSPYELIQNEK